MIFTTIHKLRKFFTKKKIIWTILIVLVLLGEWYFAFGKKNSNQDIQVDTVKTQNIKKTVLTTGQVVSLVDLALSFQGGGVVRQIYVKEGDVVSSVQTLAVLDQGTALASLKSAQGSLAQAEANYNKILAAATTQDVAVSQAAVDVASVSLTNAKQNLLNQLATAYNDANTVVLSNTNILFSNPQSMAPQFGISGTVQTNQQLVNEINTKRITINSLLPDWETDIWTEENIDILIENSLNNLLTISNYLSDIINVLSTHTQITTGGSQTTLSTYQTSVVNGKTTVDGAYTTITTYNQAVRSARASLDQAKATLSLKQSPTRPEDVDIAVAQVLSAQGQVDSAQVALNSDVNTLKANGCDVAVIRVAIKDEKGRVVPTADNMVKFSIEGPGKIIGTGNGNPKSHEPDKASQRLAFNGYCLVLVQSEKQTGVIRLIATSDNLKGAEVLINAE